MTKNTVAKGAQKSVKIKKELKSRNSNSRNDVNVATTAEKPPSHKLDPTFIGNVSSKGTTKVTDVVDKCKISRSDLVVAEPPKKDIAKTSINKDTDMNSKKKPTKPLTKPQKNKEPEVSETKSAIASDITPPESENASSNGYVPDAAPSSTKHSWQTTDSKKYFEHEKIRTRLENYVKDNLFHTLKFVSSPAVVQYSIGRKSLCQVVCKHMNVVQSEQQVFWGQYSKVIEKKLNQKRSDVSNIMKKEFKGKKSICKMILFSTLILTIIFDQNCMKPINSIFLCLLLLTRETNQMNTLTLLTIMWPQLLEKNALKVVVTDNTLVSLCQKVMKHWH
jgi:hypothetical protein